MEPVSKARIERGQAFVILLAVVGGLAAAMAGSPRPDGPPPPPPLEVEASEPIVNEPPARVVLLAHTTPTGAVDVATVYGFERPSEGAALLIPPSTLVEVPSLGTQTIADAVRLGSVDLLELAVENALGITIDETVVLDDTEVALAFAPANNVEIDLRRDVRVEDPEGVISLSAGPQTIDAPTAARLLIAPVAAQGELDQQPVIRASLEAWRRAVRDASVADQARLVDENLHSLVDQAGAAVHYDTLPVDGISVGGTTRYSIRRADADELVARALGFALVAGGGDRPRVEILNGSGAIRVTPRVAQVVVPNGGEVTRTDNVPGFGVAESQIQYQDEADADAAHRLAEALGIVRVTAAAQPVNVVDVSIVIGADFAPAP